MLAHQLKCRAIKNFLNWSTPFSRAKTLTIVTALEFVANYPRCKIYVNICTHANRSRTDRKVARWKTRVDISDGLLGNRLSPVKRHPVVAFWSHCTRRTRDGMREVAVAGNDDETRQPPSSVRTSCIARRGLSEATSSVADNLAITSANVRLSIFPLRVQCASHLPTRLSCYVIPSPPSTFRRSSRERLSSPKKIPQSDDSASFIKAI